MSNVPAPCGSISRTIVRARLGIPRRVAAGVALLAMAACWPSPTDTGFHSHVLVVDVRDIEANPLADVNLALRIRDAAPEAPAVAQRRTDAQGRVNFGEQLGAFEIHVSVPPGFALAAGQANPVFVGVEEGRGETLVMIVLQRLTH